MYINNNNVTYFDSFGVEHIPKEIKIFIGNKNMVTNIYKTQAYSSTMCGKVCIRFIDIMLRFCIKGSKFARLCKLLSPNDYEETHKRILKYFQEIKNSFCE